MSTIKRFAILIESSHVAGHDDLAGARKDIQLWKSFLMSDLGGAWDTSEIVELHMPSLNLVKGYIKAHLGDYVFVAFSGHGKEEEYTDGTSTIFACLNNSDGYVKVDEITPQYKGVAVFDCCRWNDGTLIKKGFALANAVPAMDSIVENTQRYAVTDCERKTIRLNKKKAYLDYLEKCGTYPVQMFACAKRESANDDENGGFYTTLLINGAKQWEKDIAWKFSNYIVYTTKQAHDYASAKMFPERGSSQKPEYRSASFNQQYPFAVG